MARKLFIAVHGVGDQKQFDTVQLVASQVLRAASRDYGPRLSLGTFSSGAVATAPPPSTTTAVHWHPSKDSDLGFAEVYWADLCRKPDREGFRLEPGVPWAQTLVDRVRALKQFADAEKKKAESPKTTATRKDPEPDFELTRAVLGEMGDGLHLIGWLTKLAPQLQLPTFDVDDIVNQYLGDVQFVAEFGDIREQILERFRTTMKGVSATANLQVDDQIYLITHSEGTVVTLLGLLRAMTVGDQPPTWLKHLHGWMTIGSPIDKHLILWPELWADYQCGPKHVPKLGNMERKIVWWNYADCGDPIGFELDSMRKWMRNNSAPNNSWTKAFQFEDTQGIYESIFTRYKWPGQAHLDYWDDKELFDHFLGAAATIGNPPKKTPVGQQRPPVLPDQWKEKIWSLTVPYLMAFVVLMAGVFFLDKGIWAAQGLEKDKELSNFTLEVFSLSLLLAGTTVLARMPRIVNVKMKFNFTALSLVIFWIFINLFVISFPSETDFHLRKQLRLPDWIFLTEWFAGVALVVGMNASLLRSYSWQVFMKMISILVLGSLLVMSCAKIFHKKMPYFNREFQALMPDEWSQWIGLWATVTCFAVTMLWTVWEKRKEHSAGLWPLIGPGFVGVVGIGAALAVVKVAPTQKIDIHVADKVAQPELWPFFLGAVAFLYLWKLAAILFDLTFVWHRYIKQNVMLKWFRNNLVP